MSYKEFASNLLNYVGGESNMEDVYSCMTRLRIIVHDKSKVQLKNIEAEKVVKKAQYKGNELQIVIGPDVNKAYEEFKDIINESSFQQRETKDNKSNFLSKIVDFLGGIFVPILPALIAGGMVKSISTLLNIAGWIEPTGDINVLLNVLGDSVFYFLPFFLAVSTARVLKTNEYLAVMIAAIILYPTLTHGLESGATTLGIYGLSIPVISYSASVFPIVLGIILLKYVYQFFEAVIHENVRMVFSPLLTILITGFLTLAFIAPMGHYLGIYLAEGIAAVFNWNGVLASTLIGGFLPLIIMAGMHQALFPLMINNLAENGFETMLPLFYLQTLAIAGATFAVFFTSKNKDVKSVSASTGITAFLGITEPALYGITIPLKKPLIATFIGSGVAGGLSYFLGVRSYAFGLPSILSIPTYVNQAEGSSLTSVLIASVVSFGVAFILSYIFMQTNKETEVVSKEEEVNQPLNSELTRVVGNEDIYSPIQGGELLNISDVPDKVFAEQLLGPSVAIRPKNGDIFAPTNGEISMVADTKHAIGMTSENGLEILLHIGLDTVKLGGKPFAVKVKAGDKVKQGDLIAKVDLNYLEENDIDNVVILAITNDNDIENITTENDLVTIESIILQK